MDAESAIQAANDLSDRGRHLRMLITSAGRRVELLQCFRNSARELGVQLAIYGCDANPQLSAACRLADDAWEVPPANEPRYAEAVLDLCVRHDLSLVVPTIDPELAPLSQAKQSFVDAGVEVAISSPETIAIARDKLATARFLTELGIATPRTELLELNARSFEDWNFPLIVKPRHGSASRGVRTVANASELGAITGDEEMVVQERLVGVEYTVNLYFDRSGKLRCAVPHERLQVRAGEVEKGRTRRMPEFAQIASRLETGLPAPRGAMCFQAIVDDQGQASVFEINARFGGGYPLADRAGATMTRWLLEEHLGDECTAGDHWREGVAMLRYDAAVFLE